MPTYTVKDPRSNRTVKLTGDSPPTEQELHQIFAKLGAEAQAPMVATGGGRGTGLNLQRSEDFAQGMGASIPFAGIETPESGHGMAGRAVGEVAQAAIPIGAAVKVAGKVLPSAARAGQKFQEVMGAAKSVPIDISEPGNQALRIMQLGERGGSVPKAVRDFVRRVTDPNKPDMTYDEARDFASNISRLSADEFSRLPRGMRREVGNLRVALNKSVERAAESAGKGDQYRSAMKEYSRAAKGREMVDDVKDAAMRWAVPAGLTAYGLNKASDLLKGQD